MSSLWQDDRPLPPQALMPQARNQRRLQVYGSRHLKRRPHGRAQHFHGDRIGQSQKQQGTGGLGLRQHLEGHLAHDGERAPAAGESAAKVDPGNVLHHPAARLENLTPAVDRTQPEQGLAGPDPVRGCQDLSGRVADIRR